MKYLVYGFSSILTSDAAATAVLRYTAALGQSALTDVVAVPAVDLSGMPTDTSIVLGPGIPVLVEEAGDDALEVQHQSFVNDVAARTRAALAGAPHR